MYACRNLVYVLSFSRRLGPLSVEQKTLAEERIRDRGLEGRVCVHLMHYRDIPAEWEHVFNVFVSIEMLEHVGSKVSTEY